MDKQNSPAGGLIVETDSASLCGMPGTSPAHQRRPARTFCAGLALALLSLGSLLASQDLITLSEAKLIPTDWGDGDSFLIQFIDPESGKTRKETFRLYAVDCMETSTAFESDRRRLLDQARHFGVEDPSLLIAEGRASTGYVREILAKPFSVHTAFARALGRSSKPRYYAFVSSSGGNDLAKLLVQNGHARVKGIARSTPDGSSREEYAAQLSDLEITAAMNRSGVWKLSDSSRLADLRADKRREERELAAIEEVRRKNSPMDVNTASQNELETLPGIGAVTAARIIKKRPYSSLDELQKVKGINEDTLSRLKPLLKISTRKKKVKPESGKPSTLVRSGVSASG